MHAVQAAATAGRVTAEAFEELRQLFNALQARAIKAFGERELLGASRSLDPEKYRPPLPEEFEKQKPVGPVHARTSPQSERLARARVLVDQIRDHALAVGWSMDNLYFCDGYERRPIRPRYGLVCYVGAEQRIGEVTRPSIELIGPPPLEVRNRFYNPGVEQPWIKRTTFRCTESTAQASTQGLHFPRASRMFTVKAQFDSRAQGASSERRLQSNPSEGDMCSPSKRLKPIKIRSGRLTGSISIPQPAQERLLEEVISAERVR
jgi:hypothetical protein